ncbi:hypothetical protein I8748_31885 [Nostoc sp. CENA67]|uniref:Uncharacterized protein n=1 Tax=Amazonocrinis nigriterrae CENA67 TaxID=2794033 RepID=A0A8J7HYS5_9NOST|nr:hypothetical protein [Amazonocrinis nigriterrae]MBH8566700.1 hypothetical protein [Amazonocrinis nigriterrae CENA67]
MTKTVFVNGSPVTADFLNSINNPVFDGQDFDGHCPLITNSDLSSAAGQIKPEWEAFRDTLKVIATSGLTIGYTGGAVRLQDGSFVAINPGNLVLADNSISYVYINESGVIVQSTTYPLRALMLAQIFTVSGNISGSIIDLRPRYQVQPLFNAVKIFGGSGDEGNYSLSGTDTLSQGEYFFKSFTINAGAVLTIDKLAYIRVSGDVAINGTINIATATAGGGSFATTLPSGNLGGNSGAGPGAGIGNLTNGSAYSYLLAPHGSGGASGFVSISPGGNATIAAGGRGGGGLIIDCGGKITINGTITALGGNAGAGVLNSGSANISGGGGGSGGLILLRSLRQVVVSATAVLSVKGGNGSNGIVGNGAGGHGGGGGVVGIVSPSINTSGSTILLNGGTMGTTSGDGSTGGGAGGSFGGLGGLFPSIAAQSGQLILRQFLPIG